MVSCLAKNTTIVVVVCRLLVVFCRAWCYINETHAVLAAQPDYVLLARVDEIALSLPELRDEF